MVDRSLARQLEVPLAQKGTFFAYLMGSVYCYYRDSNTTDHALLQAVSVVQGRLAESE